MTKAPAPQRPLNRGQILALALLVLFAAFAVIQQIRPEPPAPAPAPAIVQYTGSRLFMKLAISGQWQGKDVTYTVNRNRTGKVTWLAGPCDKSSRAHPCYGMARIQFTVQNQSVAGILSPAIYTDGQGNPPPNGFEPAYTNSGSFQIYELGQAEAGKVQLVRGPDDLGTILCSRLAEPRPTRFTPHQSPNPCNF